MRHKLYLLYLNYPVIKYFVNKFRREHIGERILAENAKLHPGHVYRYQFAAKYCKSKDTVLDIACGVGYGSEIISYNKDVSYIGVDKISPAPKFRKFGTFVSNVDIMRFKPSFSFDIAISFETLEHMLFPSKLIRLLKYSKRLIIFSTPTQPTKHFNSHHLHDFTVNEIIKMFEPWNLIHIENQPEEMSHIFVFQNPEFTTTGNSKVSG
jgi:2-polyprenyl-3-methyl-5-hydroxy-6-metoxy-1,4-benzoquinol methylase